MGLNDQWLGVGWPGLWFGAGGRAIHPLWVMGLSESRGPTYRVNNFQVKPGGMIPLTLPFIPVGLRLFVVARLLHPNGTPVVYGVEVSGSKLQR